MYVMDPDLIERTLVALEECRSEVERRLRATGGIPTTWYIHVLETERTGGETSSRYVRRDRSTLITQEFVRRIRDDSVEGHLLGLRPQLEDLAVFLATESHLGKPPQYGLQPGGDGAEGVLRRVLSPLARHYCTSLADVAVPDSDLADTLARELAAVAASPTVEIVHELPLAGVHLDERYDGDDLSIRPLSPEEVGRFVEATRVPDPYGEVGHRSGVVVPNRSDFQLPAAVLELRQERPYDSGPLLETRPERFLLAAAVSRVSLSTTGWVVTYECPRWMHGGYSVRPIDFMPQVADDSRRLERDEFATVVDLMSRLPAIDRDEPNREAIILSRTLRGAGSKDSGFIDFMIALEAALLEGSQAELSFRFRLYGALYLADDRPVNETYRKLLEIYRTRSRLLHGDSVRAEELASSEAEARDIALDIVRRGIAHGWPDANRLNDSALRGNHASSDA